MALQQAEKASKESKGKKRDDAYSGPHSVWDSITELGGDAAAAKGDRQIAQALTQAIQQEGGGSSQEEVAAALATQEMADAASGVMAEASRLASDIISAGKFLPARFTLPVCQMCTHDTAALIWHCFKLALLAVSVQQKQLPSLGRPADLHSLLPSVQHQAGLLVHPATACPSDYVIRWLKTRHVQHAALLCRECCQRGVSSERQKIRITCTWT